MSRAPILALILLMSIGDAAQAGCWLTDWITGNKDQPQPVVAGYMPAAPPQPYQVNYIQPPAPTTCAPIYQNQTSVRYIPETQYQTTYKPVPVTVYQPTTVYLPGSNVPTLAYNGCTTYRWQTERVPYTTYKPVIQNVQQQINSCATVGYMQTAPAVVGSCNSCAGAPAAYNAQPQMAPAQPYPGGNGGQWVPAQGGGASSMVNPPATYPQGTAQPMPNSQYNVAPYQGSTPADQPPALNPNEVTPPSFNNQNTRRVSPEGNSVLQPTPRSTIIQPSPQPAGSPSSQPKASVPKTPSVTAQPLGQSFTPYAPSSSPAAPSTATPSITTPSTTAAPRSVNPPQINPLIKPIPDRDYYPTHAEPQTQAPQLLNPNDKSAMAPTAKIVPIAWDDVAKPVAREVSYETPTASIPAKKGGWHQIGQ
ncbi:MAG: hypothetical protein ACIALR_10005 [Blastopirellula sp. JB062]